MQLNNRKNFTKLSEVTLIFLIIEIISTFISGVALLIIMLVYMSQGVKTEDTVMYIPMIVLSLISLAWQIPMSLHYNKKKGEVSAGFCVCSFIFCGSVPGILMMCDYNQENNESDAIRNNMFTDLSNIAYGFFIVFTILTGLLIIPLAWFLPMLLHYKHQKGIVSKKFKICALFFCLFIPGIIMCCDTQSTLKKK